MPSALVRSALAARAGLLTAAFLFLSCRQPFLLFLAFENQDPTGTRLELELAIDGQTRILDVSPSLSRGQLAVQIPDAADSTLTGELRVLAGPLGCVLQSATLDPRPLPKPEQSERLSVALSPRSGCVLTVVRQGSGTVSGNGIGTCSDSVCTHRILDGDRLTVQATPTAPADTITWQSPASCQGRPDCPVSLDPLRATQISVLFSTGPAPPDACSSARVVAVSPAPPAPASANLTSVYGNRSTDLYVSGDQELLLKLSGNTWTKLTLPPKGMQPYTGTLRALTGAGSVLWAAGDDDGVFLSLGGSVMNRSTAFGASFLGAASLSTTEHVFVGTSGMVAKTDPMTGALVVYEPPSTTVPLRTAFWRSSSELWVAGGLTGISAWIFKQTPGMWSNVSPSAPSRPVRAMHGPAAGPIWAVGDSGMIWLSDANGTNWKVPSSVPMTTENLNGVHTTGTRTVIVGDNGALWCQSTPDSVWRALSGAGTAHLNAVHGSPSGTGLWVVGANRSMYEIQL